MWPPGGAAGVWERLYTQLMQDSKMCSAHTRSEKMRMWFHDYIFDESFQVHKENAVKAQHAFNGTRRASVWASGEVAGLRVVVQTRVSCLGRESKQPCSTHQGSNTTPKDHLSAQMDNRTGSDLLHHVSLTLDRIWIWGFWIDSSCTLSRPTGSVLGQCGVGMVLEVHEDAAVGSSSKLSDFFFFSTMTLIGFVAETRIADVSSGLWGHHSPLSPEWSWNLTVGPAQGGRELEWHSGWTDKMRSETCLH